LVAAREGLGIGPQREGQTRELRRAVARFVDSPGVVFGGRGPLLVVAVVLAIRTLVAARPSTLPGLVAVASLDVHRLRLGPSPILRRLRRPRDRARVLQQPRDLVDL